MVDGQYFAAEILFHRCTGRVHVTEHGAVYLCQDVADGSDGHFGYKYKWCIGTLDRLELVGVKNLVLLPSQDKYHELFWKLLDGRRSTWDEDGSYSVVPKETIQLVSDFVKGIEKVEPK